jgi:hypothetical protein
LRLGNSLRLGLGCGLGIIVIIKIVEITIEVDDMINSWLGKCRGGGLELFVVTFTGNVGSIICQVTTIQIANVAKEIHC